MNDEAAEVKKLLAPLRDRPVSVADVERLSLRRARVVASLKQENVRLYDRRAQRRALSVGLAAALSVAAAAGAWFGVRHLSAPASPSLAQAAILAEPRLTLLGGDTSASANGRLLHAGDSVGIGESEIQTATRGPAEFKGSSGLDLSLAEATQLSVAGILGDKSSNHVDLRHGEVTCRVPHLADGERFSVVTPDARVVVHGTVFSVRFDPTLSSGNQTCVRVTQGVVIVYHGSGEIALNAGDAWGCSALEGAPAAASAPASEVTQNSDDVTHQPSPAVKSSHVALRSPPRDVPAHGTLAEETKLLQSALASERVGNLEQARTLLQTLLSEYPSSPLSHEAARALARVSAEQ
ncbi:MAG TPA: FecR domain-containing protein [Polyangiaceae bacterium]|jgi:hypothetical protein